MTEPSKDTRAVSAARIVNKNVSFEIKTAESSQERDSRLRREEAAAEHALRSQVDEDAHKRQIALIVHIFVMAVVAIAFLASTYITVAIDPKSGLPDKAMGIITAIVAALVGYLTGKNSK